MSTPSASKRWRCLAAGCNPKLNEATAVAHKESTGHRVAKWPVRSAAGKAKARERNRSGYYDKYNVGAKSASARGLRPSRPFDVNDEAYPFGSSESLGQR